MPVSNMNGVLSSLIMTTGLSKASLIPSSNKTLGLRPIANSNLISIDILNNSAVDYTSLVAITNHSCSEFWFGIRLHRVTDYGANFFPVGCRAIVKFSKRHD